jgi:hypothetical protein
MLNSLKDCLQYLALRASECALLPYDWYIKPILRRDQYFVLILYRSAHSFIFYIVYYSITLSRKLNAHVSLSLSFVGSIGASFRLQSVLVKSLAVPLALSLVRSLVLSNAKRNRNRIECEH